MIAVTGVSMRFGSKVLFEDVTTTFSAGRRYGLTGPNGSGKSTFMKLLTGEIAAAGGHGGASRQARRAAARTSSRSTSSASIDTVIMGNERLWKALDERERLYDVADMTDERRHAPRPSSRGSSAKRTATPRRATPRCCSTASTSPSRSTSARCPSCRAARRSACCSRRRCSADRRRCCSTSRRTTSTSTRSTGCATSSSRYAGTLIVISHDRHFLNGVCTHIADIDYQTIITYTGGYDDMVVAKTQIRSKVESDNAQREKKIDQLKDFIARFSAGTRASQVHVAPQGSRAPADDRAGALEHPAPVHQVHDEPPVGPHGDGDQGRHEGASAKHAGHRRLRRDRQPRREDRHRRPQRRRQDDAAEGAAVGRARRRCRVAEGPRRGVGPLGPRSVGRLLPAGPHRPDRRRG